MEKRNNYYNEKNLLPHSYTHIDKHIFYPMRETIYSNFYLTKSEHVHLTKVLELWNQKQLSLHFYNFL